MRKQWGDLDRVFWGLQKLVAVKADIKILIFQMEHTRNRELPDAVKSGVEEHMSNSGHYHPGHDFYLLIQFHEKDARLFLWEPKHSGPFGHGEIEFIEVN